MESGAENRIMAMTVNPNAMVSAPDNFNSTKAPL
jgi:hypothetical protein